MWRRVVHGPQAAARRHDGMQVAAAASRPEALRAALGALPDTAPRCCSAAWTGKVFSSALTVSALSHLVRRMPKKAPARRPPLLQSKDFTAYLNEKCAQIATGDLEEVIRQASSIRERAAEDAATRPRMQRQAEFALMLVEEHEAGRAPQIPLYTIAMMGVALLYFADPLDVIPDWIPGIGRSDDALVFELAFGLARAGIERYCAWKSLPTDGILSPPARPTTNARRPASRKVGAKPRRR